MCALQRQQNINRHHKADNDHVTELDCDRENIESGITPVYKDQEFFNE